MKKNCFTNEQQEQLRANPYIEKVSDKTITYTKEFRETFMAKYQTGELPSQILREMDIDPRLLGKRRIDSIVHRSKQYELRPEGCEDTRRSNSGRPTTKDLSNPEKIKFLKKNMQMDRLARLDNKHHRPSNID